MIFSTPAKTIQVDFSYLSVILLGFSLPLQTMEDLLKDPMS